MQEQRKCDLNGCNNYATHKIRNNIVLDDDSKLIIKNYIYLCDKHYLGGKIKEFVTLKGQEVIVYLVFLKNDTIDFFIDNQVKKEFAGVKLDINDIKWLIYFMLKNEAKLNNGVDRWLYEGKSEKK